MTEKQAYFKDYYQKNKVSLKENISQWQKENKEKVRSYKKKCKDTQKTKLRELIQEIKYNSACSCGETATCCLEFHHLRDKDALIARLVSNAVSTEKLQSEISKCKIVCSNCHRKIHCNKPSQNRMLKFKLAYKIKCERGCHFCSENYYACLDFHHLKDKIDTIGNMTKQKQYTLEDVQSEIEKCIVVCSNCHRKLHNGLLKSVAPIGFSPTFSTPVCESFLILIGRDPESWR